MKYLMKILLLVVIFTNSVTAESATFLDFNRGVYEKARVKAAQEGKLLFLDFYAKWCTPCKWMDETTFTDPNVMQQLNEKYIAIKVDIDDMEGFELKSKFDIRYLPTMLIFNAEGKMVERIEETLSPSKLTKVLDSHALLRPNRKIKHQINMSPRDIGAANAAENSDDDMVLSQAEYREYFSQTSTTYQVQLGVFSSIESASNKVANLKETFIEEIKIVEDARGDKILYKVLMGEFASLSSAESYQKILKDKYNLDSILY